MSKLVGTLCTLTLTTVIAPGCVDAPASAGVASAESELAASRARAGVAPLPCFEDTPAIAAAASSLLPAGTVVRAVYSTESGAQIYRRDRNAQGTPVRALRTPVAHLKPSKKTQQRLGDVALADHVRSDFGAMLSPTELASLGLFDAAGAPVNAPVWAFTFSGESPQIAEERETVAGRLVAADTIGSGNIPNLLLEVRGRSVAGIADGIVVGATFAADPVDDAIAASDYLLRWNLRGGVAPAAALCT